MPELTTENQVLVLTSKCTHPEPLRRATKAYIPNEIGNAVGFGDFQTVSAFRCAGCGRYVVPDGILTEIRPLVKGAVG